MQYGPVDIGGKTYICPIRSEAIAQVHVSLESVSGTIPTTAMNHGPIRTRLNEVTFTHYHIYRGESRILTDAEAAQMNGQPAGSNRQRPSAAIRGRRTPASLRQTRTSASKPLRPPRSATAQAAPAAGIMRLHRTPLPPTPLPSSANSANIPVFHTTARQVLVDVVVDKKNGDPVPDVPKSDFSIEENGKPQTIDFFEEHSAGSSAPG